MPSSVCYIHFPGHVGQKSSVKVEAGTMSQYLIQTGSPEFGVGLEPEVWDGGCPRADPGKLVFRGRV